MPRISTSQSHRARPASARSRWRASWSTRCTTASIPMRSTTATANACWSSSRPRPMARSPSFRRSRRSRTPPIWRPRSRQASAVRGSAEMARSLWTGSLSFGLVNVPVSLVSAVRDLDLHFRQLHEKDGAPIEVQRWCEKEDVEVPYEEITHAYELDDGGQVIVSDL